MQTTRSRLLLPALVLLGVLTGCLASATAAISPAHLVRAEGQRTKPVAHPSSTERRHGKKCKSGGKRHRRRRCAVPVARHRPVETRAPVVSGTLIVGRTVTATSGSWSNAPTSYKYRWKRCNYGGSDCAVISGAPASRSRYTIGSADVGHALVVSVTARNSGGSATSVSAATSVAGTVPSPTWSWGAAGSWGVGTRNSYSRTNGWFGFDGVPNGFIGSDGWSFTNGHYSFSGNPVYPGSKYSYDATVDSGAVTSGEEGQRTGLYLSPLDPATTSVSGNASGAYQGSDQWYREEVYFPTSFSPEPKTSWNFFDEFHNYPNTICCANLSFTLVTDSEDGGRVDPTGRISVRVLGGGSPSKPIPAGTNMGSPGVARSYGGKLSWFRGPQLQLGHWYDLLYHVVWDYAGSGQVQVWLDCNQIVNYSGPTLYYYADDSASTNQSGPGNDYWWSGYYRAGTRNGATDTQVDSVYHDRYMRGPTLDSVGG
jgi:hypothetical protein